MEAARQRKQTCMLVISSWKSTVKTQLTCWMWRPRTKSRTQRPICSFWWRGTKKHWSAFTVTVDLVLQIFICWIYKQNKYRALDMLDHHKYLLHPKWFVCSKATIFVLCSPPSSKHCTNKTSDCNQGKCQDVWEPLCSFPCSLLIGLVVRFAETLFECYWKLFLWARASVGWHFD